MKAHNQELTPLAHTAHNRCFGCGAANPIGLHLEFLLAEDRTVVCLASIPDTFEGPRGYLHGGIIATLLDETMSKAVRSHNLVAMTRHMEVDYKRPVPSCTPIRLEGRVYHHEGRKHWAEADILDDAGTLLAHGKGLFIEVRPRHEKVSLAGEPAPHG
jgi:uncharacterized protein (TIGR00369 family)